MKKVLIVEDERPLARVLSDHLGKSGYETEIAVDGEEALNKIVEFKPDLILLDILLPKVDGMQVLKVLKKKDQTKDIPTILLTNLDSKENMEEAAQLGVTLYFIKANTSLKVLNGWVKALLEE